MRVRCIGLEDHQGNGGKRCIKCGAYQSQIKGGLPFVVILTLAFASFGILTADAQQLEEIIGFQANGQIFYLSNQIEHKVSKHNDNERISGLTISGHPYYIYELNNRHLDGKVFLDGTFVDIDKFEVPQKIIANKTLPKILADKLAEPEIDLIVEFGAGKNKRFQQDQPDTIGQIADEITFFISGGNKMNDKPIGKFTGKITIDKNGSIVWEKEYKTLPNGQHAQPVYVSPAKFKSGAFYNYTVTGVLGNYTDIETGRIWIDKRVAN